MLNHYWKHGLYRNRQELTSILYLDDLTRQISPVPEPSVFAMLLAGSGLLAGVTARHRSS